MLHGDAARLPEMAEMLVIVLQGLQHEKGRSLGGLEAKMQMFSIGWGTRIRT
jgi:hypothetical protein